MSDTSSASHAAPQSLAVVQLYDTALKHIGNAIEGVKKGSYETQMNEIAAAVRIFNGLNDSLDMEAGGAVAQNLRDMYQAVSKALLSTIGQDNAVEICERMTKAVKETRNAWAEIAKAPLI